MTNAEFKPFYNAIDNAGANDDVWYDLWMWMDMTKNQLAKVSKLLDSKGCVKTVTNARGACHQIPSGLLIKKI